MGNVKFDGQKTKQNCLNPKAIIMEPDIELVHNNHAPFFEDNNVSVFSVVVEGQGMRRLGFD